MDYKYALKTWGGFYNKEFYTIHQKKEGYYFFLNLKELNEYLNFLKLIESELSAYKLMYTISSLNEDSHITYAKMLLCHNDIEYEIVKNFGIDYPEETVEYMFSEGNYSCDCNRKIFLNEKYDLNLDIECGNDIIITKFEVIKEKFNFNDTNFLEIND